MKNKFYEVVVNCHEDTCTVDSVKHQNPPALQGGYKNKVAFLTWLQRRSEEPAPKEIQCYGRKKTVLSKVETSLKFEKVKSIEPRSIVQLGSPNQDF